MSALLENAKKIAEEKAEAQRKEAERIKQENDQYQILLEEMTDSLMKELFQIDGQQCKYGTFKLEKVHYPNSYNIVAYLTVNTLKVAWFKAKVVRGNYNYDGVQVPYTEPRIWARFYFPNSHQNSDHDGSWDYSESKYYANGGQTIDCSKIEQLPKFFEAMTNQLAKWM